MNTPPVIAYNPTYAVFPSATGKPIGHSAALMLSQFVWLSANRAIDEEGWIECSYEEMLAWGFTRTEQETCRRILRDAGYLQEKKGGGGVSTRFLLCGKPAMNTAGNLQSEPVSLRETCSDIPNTAGNLQCSESEHCGKPAMNTAGNPQRYDDAVSIKDTNTLEESTPPISPPRGKTPSLPKRVREAFTKPTLEQVKEYLTELGIGHKAAKFWNFYESKGWVVGKTPMKDWRAAGRNWAQDENPAPVRGSPCEKPTQDERDNVERDAIIRIMARRQQANG